MNDTRKHFADTKFGVWCLKEKRFEQRPFAFITALASIASVVALFFALWSLQETRTQTLLSYRPALVMTASDINANYYLSGTGKLAARSGIPGHETVYLDAPTWSLTLKNVGAGPALNVSVTFYTEDVTAISDSYNKRAFGTEDAFVTQGATNVSYSIKSADTQVPYPLGQLRMSDKNIQLGVGDEVTLNADALAALYCLSALYDYSLEALPSTVQVKLECHDIYKETYGFTTSINISENGVRISDAASDGSGEIFINMDLGTLAD